MATRPSSSSFLLTALFAASIALPFGGAQISVAGPSSESAATASLTQSDASATTQTAQVQERHVVQLASPPLALYAGGIAGLEPTNPHARGELRLDPQSAASVAYLAHLDAEHEAVLAAMAIALGREVEVVFHYFYAFNGMAVVITPEEAATVSGLPGVVRISPEEHFDLQTDAGPRWIDAEEVWDGTATGAPNMGEGVIVGVIDTGVKWDHPSFAAVGPVTGHVHQNPRGVQFGECAPVDVQGRCNDKLIGLYDFTLTGLADTIGHGSHVASTAAGNVVDATLFAPTTDVTRRISGVAPHANIISYKACTDTFFLVNLGACPITALIAAIDQATADVVDVVNFSIGGGSTNPWTGLLAQPFFGTYAAGVVTVTSAGNAGPNPQTMGQPANAPWMMAVGASTSHRSPSNFASFSGGAFALEDIRGVGLTSGVGPAPLVDAAELGNRLCDPFTAEQAEQVAGKIVICDQGVIARVAKGQNVGNAGGVGMIHVGLPSNVESLIADPHFVPATMITFSAGQRLREWLAGGDGHQATLSGLVMEEDPALGDRIGAFSSRGPDLNVPTVIKPDVTAPGVAIWAAWHAHLTGSSPTEGAPPYNMIAGTSMSSPHTAGAAALVRAANPLWTADMVRSALMTTAYVSPNGGKETVPNTKEDHVTPADPFDIGAGRVAVGAAARAGFALNEIPTSYQAANPALGGDPTQLNLASLAHTSCDVTCDWARTLISTSSGPVTWTVTAATTGGFSLAVSPSTFTIGDPLGLPTVQTITVTATNTGLIPGIWAFGQVTFTPDDPSVPVAHFPVAVLTRGAAPEQACEIEETVVGTAPASLTVPPHNDVREVAVAGLFPSFGGDPIPNIFFRMRVTDLDAAGSGLLPPNSHWRVAWVSPTDGVNYFVQLLTDTMSQPTFVYGTLVPGTFTILGSPDSGTFDLGTGDITWTIAASKVGSPTVGQTLTSIIGASGTAQPGLVTTNLKSTPAGSYTLTSCVVEGGPIAVDDSATTVENVPVTIDVLANDSHPEGEEIFVSAVGEPSNGTATDNGDGTITYTPAPSFSGVDSFTYTISDPQGRTDSATVTVTVESFCPPGHFKDTLEPAPADGWQVDTAANAAGPLSPTWAVVTDPNAHSPTNSWFSDATTLDLKDDRVIAPAMTITSLTRLTFWHRFFFEAGFDGGVLEVSTDGGDTWADVTTQGSFVEGTYNGTISGDFDSPIAGRAAWTGGFTGAALLPMTRVVVDLGGFVPEGEASATVLVRWRLAADPFVLGALPGHGWWVDDVEFSHLFSECNRPPVANDDFAETQAGEPVTVDVLANDFDPDGDEIAIVDVSEPANGTAVDNGDGTITYTPNDDFSGTDTFTYTISDPEGLTDTATVTVEVHEDPNQPPVAEDDHATTLRDTAVIIHVLANDHDPDGDELTVIEVTQPANGTAINNSDGTVTYTPDQGFVGTDSFTYTISDGRGGTDSATVTVDVVAPECEVKFTGGTRITTEAGDRALFSGGFKQTEDGASGNHNYQDQGTGLKVKTRDVQSMLCGADKTSAVITGRVSVDGVTLIYEVTVDVSGDAQTYRMRLSNGYDSGTRPLDQGTISIR